MKKRIALTALGLLTLAGGSWLAAQQSDLPRTPLSADPATPNESADDSELANGDVVEKRAAQDSANARRPRVASPQSSARSRQAQDAWAAADVYNDDLARLSREAQRSIPELPVVGQRPGMPDVRHRMTPEDAARMRAFQDAIKELREAESAEKKAAAREQVTKLVSEQLEVDLENRENELAAIEQRAKELRKQLEERKNAKPELLKMLVMLIDNPQVGLGIPPEWMQMLMRGQPDGDRFGNPRNTPAKPLYSPPLAPRKPASPPSALAPSNSRNDPPNASTSAILGEGQLRDLEPPSSASPEVPGSQRTRY